MERGTEIYRTLNTMLKNNEITTTMIIAPEIGSICSIYYGEMSYKVIVVKKELLPTKDGYDVTFRFATDEEVVKNKSK